MSPAGEPKGSIKSSGGGPTGPHPHALPFMAASQDSQEMTFALSTLKQTIVSLCKMANKSGGKTRCQLERLRPQVPGLRQEAFR